MNTLIKYVKNQKGQRIGVLGGWPNTEGDVYIGWSRCNKTDIFDKVEGVRVAAHNVGKPVPPSFLKDAKRFRTQCFEHFEDAGHIQKIEVMKYARQPRSRWVGEVRNSGHQHLCAYPETRCICKDIAAGLASGLDYTDALKAATAMAASLVDQDE